MPGFTDILVSVLILAALVLGAAGLKRIGLLAPDHAPFLGRLVTQVTLPALILHALAFGALDWSESVLALAMAGAELGCLVLAWTAARLLRLDRPATGAFLLAAAFGSSTMLGYPLLAEVFPGQAGVITEGVLVSELGVGPVLFTLGVMLAMYYGSDQESAASRISQAARFFVSPIFAAVTLGLVCSALGPLDPGGTLKPLADALGMVGRANTFLVVLTVGVALKFQDIRRVLPPALAACLVLLVAQPLLAWLFSQPLAVTEVQRRVLVLEASMPSALLSVALSARYGCDAGLASRLVLVTAGVSVATAPLMFGLLV